MSVIRKGKDALPQSNGGTFVKITESEAVTIVPLAGLDELISVDQHAFWEVNPAVFVPCIGHDCPACKLGNQPRFKAFLPVLTKDEGAKIYAFGIQVLRQLESLEEELGSLVGQAIKIKRHGSGLTTKYTAIALGKKVSVKGIEAPDIIEAIGPTDKEGVERLLAEAGLIDAPVKPKRSHKPAMPKSEDEAKTSWDEIEDDGTDEESVEEWGDV